MLNSEILTQENKKSFMGQGDGSEGKGAMAKADNSSLIPETHMVGKNQLPQAVSDLCICS